MGLHGANIIAFFNVLHGKVRLCGVLIDCILDLPRELDAVDVVDGGKVDWGALHEAPEFQTVPKVNCCFVG